jgi:hypothetical protein
METEIKLTNVNYVINDGVITSINVTFSGYKDGQSINATVAVTGDGVADMTPTQAETKARTQLSDNVTSGMFSVKVVEK